MSQQFDTHKTAASVPYFSVILPVCNVEAFLDQCIGSILDQDFSDYELILVDDGSTDRCPEICDAYAGKHGHIRVLHKPNGGLSSARNAGAQIARGTYIWWVDSDDWIAPGALSALYRTSCQESPDMVKFSHYRVQQEPRWIRSNARPGRYTGSEETRALLDQAFFTPREFCLSAWSNLYKRDFLRKRQLSFVSEREIGSEDYLFNLQALASAEQIRVIDSPLYYYRQRAGSLTQRYRRNLPEQYTQLYQALMAHYRREKGDAYTGRICRFYVWHLIHGTCVANEYRVIPGHTMEAGRARLAAFLRSADFRYAARHCDCTGLSVKQRIQVLAMAMGAEPLLYWLYVVKPNRRKGVHHDA